MLLNLKGKIFKNLKFGDIQIKQNFKVKYLEYLLDKTMSEEAMAINVINKINNKLKFLHPKNKFLTPAPEAVIQRCSIKKNVLRNFTKFTGKHLCQSLFFNKVTGLRLQLC